jgi:hypothetical protein
MSCEMRLAVGFWQITNHLSTIPLLSSPFGDNSCCTGLKHAKGGRTAANPKLEKVIHSHSWSFMVIHGHSIVIHCHSIDIRNPINPKSEIRNQVGLAGISMITLVPVSSLSGKASSMTTLK